MRKHSNDDSTDTAPRSGPHIQESSPGSRAPFPPVQRWRAKTKRRFASRQRVLVGSRSGHTVSGGRCSPRRGWLRRSDRIARFERANTSLDAPNDSDCPVGVLTRTARDSLKFGEFLCEQMDRGLQVGQSRDQCGDLGRRMVRFDFSFLMANLLPPDLRLCGKYRQRIEIGCVRVIEDLHVGIDATIRQSLRRAQDESCSETTMSSLRKSSAHEHRETELGSGDRSHARQRHAVARINALILRRQICGHWVDLRAAPDVPAAQTAEPFNIVAGAEQDRFDKT